MADLWPLVAILAGFGVTLLVSVLGHRLQRHQAAEIVCAIKARGTITIAEGDDGEPRCPHCGHTLRSER